MRSTACNCQDIRVDRTSYLVSNSGGNMKSDQQGIPVSRMLFSVEPPSREETAEDSTAHIDRRCSVAVNGNSWANDTGRCKDLFQSLLHGIFTSTNELHSVIWLGKRLTHLEVRTALSSAKARRSLWGCFITNAQIFYAFQSITILDSKWHVFAKFTTPCRCDSLMETVDRCV